MTPNDPLKNLLERADAAFKPAPMRSSNLAEGVRRLQIRRRRRRRVAGVAAVAGLVWGAARFAPVIPLNESRDVESPLHVDRPSVPPPRVDDPAEDPTGQAEALRARLAELNFQIESTRRVVDRLRRMEAERALEADFEETELMPDPILVIQQDVEQTAATLARRAQRLSWDETSRAPAIEVYRRIVDCFPGTPGAQVAQRRLRQLQSLKGET